MWTRRLIVIVVLALCSSTAGRAQNRIPFLAVQDSEEYTRADKRLAEGLGRSLPGGVEQPVRFEQPSDLITEVVARQDAFLARMTPYAYVAARMLGARVEAVATYLRRDETAPAETFVPTYRSYFIVNAAKYGARPQTLDELFQFIKQGRGDGPSRFTFKQEFSTSGYFMPALWMRSRHIYATDEGSGAIVRIASLKLDQASYGSVIAAVDAGAADFAAVWDKDKVEYERAHQGRAPGVLFIPLPWALPNDLLVCSAAVDQATRKAIAEALDKMPPVDIGDFHSWKRIYDAPEALLAVTALERAAAAAPAPVVVEIQVGAGAEPYLEEARQAVRLAGTEFVLYDPPFHTQADVVWKLEKVHDGALVLTSDMTDTKLKSAAQRFQLSFTDAPGDLATRIVTLIHARMHRIRYVWPYERDLPTVIRDIDVSIPVGTPLKVQRITWTDPDRNDFEHGQTTDAVVQPQSNAYKFTLGKTITEFNNPLSNVAYRVVLERRSNESTAAKALTVSFIGLLVLTAIGAGFDMRRKLAPAQRAPRTLRDVCAALAWQTHDRWRGRTLKEAELLVCERPRIEELIEELKGKGLLSARMGGVTRWVYEVSGGLSIPFVRGILSGGVQGGRRIELIANPALFGNTARTSALLDVLVCQRLLSLFVGRPLEWVALNDLAGGILAPSDAPRTHERVVRAEDATVIEIASRHFNQVLDDAMNRVSLFSGRWRFAPGERGLVMRQQVPLDGPLWIGQERRVITSLVLEFNLPEAVKLPVSDDQSEFDCWVLGKIVRLTYSATTAGELCVHFRTLATLAAAGIAPVTESGLRQPVPAPPIAVGV